ncbi:MAG: type II secretion system minor pseudopilin GspJ, partial [Desulfovibrionales bacterium]|nr:type II secretion system minor pseudopilin GspJ [Desulfovibrionales bacterium]
LTFVRIGWLNPDHRLPRSELQRVYYRLVDGVLERGYDRVLDVPAGVEPVYQPLVAGVEGLKFRFYYARDNGSGRWQDRFQAGLWPAGIAVVLQLEKEGNIERRFLVPFEWGADNG